MKKVLFRISLILVIALVGYAVFYAWRSFPIIAGFGAKELCSCMFVAGRTEASVMKDELGGFPFPIASYDIDLSDSSVTGTVMGMARRKAIFRRGLGCTLVNGISESTIRQQKFNLPPSLPGNPDTIPWPDGDLLTDTFPKSIDSLAMVSAVNAAFLEPDPNKKTRTRAVVVLYDGQLVVEKYADGFNRNTRLHGWSMTKSFGAALIGILVNDGKLSVMKSAPVPEWPKGDPRHEITLQHLLQQTSGLDFKEDYSGYSNVTNMLFNVGDMTSYAAGLPLKHKPGTVFNYSGGNSNLLSKVMRETIGARDYHAFPYARLFHKIGMRSAIIEPDASSNYVISSYMFATARDYARFGLLYLKDGKWNGEQILPPGWVDQTKRPAVTNQYKNHGYQFWIKGMDHHPPHLPNFVGVPDDLYYADGYGYQEIYIIPSKKLVIVRLGLTLDGSFDETSFLKAIINSVTK